MDEVGRRQEEWEKEIETLDQKDTPMTSSIAVKKKQFDSTGRLFFLSHKVIVEATFASFSENWVDFPMFQYDSIALSWEEMELHQSQLRLIREQTAIFIRDLAILQGEALWFGRSGWVDASIAVMTTWVQVSALKDNVGIGISANIAPLQSDIKEQKVGNLGGWLRIQSRRSGRQHVKKW